MAKTLLGDAALALLAFALSLGLLVAGTDSHAAPDTWAVVVTAAASLPLIAHRRAPVTVFVVTALASVALRSFSEPAGPPVGPTIALYFAVLAGSRTRLLFALAVALILAHAAATAFSTDIFPATPIAFGFAVWGGAWLVADRVRLRHERMAELEQRALRAEREAQRERRLAAAEERTRIARDLHDSAGHALNVILVHAGLGRLRATGDAVTHDTFQTIEDVARETVADIEQLVAALRDDGGEAAVEPPPGLAALDTLVRRHREAGLDVATTISGERGPLAPGVDRGAYRILQEALTNSARHGRGRASVGIVFGARALELTVDNSVGIGETRREGRAGHGLVGIRERAALLGGSVDTTVRDGQFRLHARLPL
jgi:signal transduction histidine kinase